MRAETGKKKRNGSLRSALLLGVIFGIMLVVCQELIYQYSVLRQYEESNHFVTSVPKPALPAPPLPSAMWLGDPPPEPDAAVNDGTPPGYRYLADSNTVFIDIGDAELPIDFAELKSINGDFTGWFVIPGTDISYPVVQGSDNSFYLNHIFDGSYSMVGALFADFRNVMLSDENTIIYGHNFHRFGAMFSKLIYYEGQEYYDAHPVMYYLTEDGGYRIEIFSVYEASTSDPIYTLTFATDAEYAAFLSHVASKSAIVPSVSAATTQDRVITLSTCSNKDPDGRFVVVGKIVPFSR